MNLPSTILLGLGLLSFAPFAETGDPNPATTVVFVCEHGSVKSLIAMQWFNRLAAERGLKVRAISRGMTPDQAVPKGIVDNLLKDGFAVENFTPARLATSDLGAAERVVSIGIDTTIVTKDSKVRVDEWAGIPPASENYAASRDAIRKRIDGLLTEMTERRRK